MFGLEQKLFDQLIRLKEEYDLQGIKAEFEAEGSSFRDVVRLRRITDKLNISLFLKIGGVLVSCDYSPEMLKYLDQNYKSDDNDENQVAIL